MIGLLLLVFVGWEGSGMYKSPLFGRVAKGVVIRYHHWVVPEPEGTGFEGRSVISHKVVGCK